MTLSSAFFSLPALNLGLRLLLAVCGGYIAAVFCGSALALWLPLTMPDATASAIILAYVLFALFGIWVFAAASLVRAVAGLIVPIAISVGLIFLKQGGGI